VKTDKITKDDTLRDEYDFSRGVRGKYLESYRQGTNLVALEPDVAAAFPNSSAVNDALRWLIRIARQSAAPAKF
jgi:hypothetical protein